MRTQSGVVRRMSVLVVAALLAVGALTACSGDDEPAGDEPTPEEVLAEAKAILDETSGVDLTLDTDDLPGGITGVITAEGIGVHPPAFEGEFELSVQGIPASAEVIAVDGVVYAKNSLLFPDWTDVTDELEGFGAPDPLNFMNPDTGFSNLLAAAEGVEKGESVRGGEDNKEILTEYSATLPAEAVGALLPTAAGDFDVVFTINEDGELREAVMTGEFYEGEDELTYTLGLSGYGTEMEITAP